MIQVINAHGTPFNVKIKEEQGKLGNIVEFYDARYTEKFGSLGQFVSSYYVFTLLETGDYPRGLCLDGGVPSWHVSSDNMDDVLNFIKDYA